MLTTEEIILRILASLILGGAIGLERQYHDKPAGFATNTLICAGSAVFALLSIASAFNYGGDPARIAAQIYIHHIMSDKMKGKHMKLFKFKRKLKFTEESVLKILEENGYISAMMGNGG